MLNGSKKEREFREGCFIQVFICEVGWWYFLASASTNFLNPIAPSIANRFSKNGFLLFSRRKKK